MKRGTPLERHLKRQKPFEMRSVQKIDLPKPKMEIYVDAIDPCDTQNRKPISGKTIALLFFAAVACVAGIMTLFAWMGGRFG